MAYPSPVGVASKAFTQGRVDCVVDSANVALAVASSALPDSLTNYQFVFTTNTTGHNLPGPSLLSVGSWTIGAMAAGTHVSYYVYRLDGAHINGSAVMRATDTTFGLTWDLTVRCPGISWGFNLPFGQRSGL